MTRTNNTTTNPYKVGDIVFIRWGYSMILIQYYKVTRVTPGKVGMVELEQNEQYTGYLSGKTTPIEDKEIAGSNAPYSAPGIACTKYARTGASASLPIVADTITRTRRNGTALR